VATIGQHGEFAERLDLIANIDGIALRIATAILVRLPETGRISSEECDGTLYGFHTAHYFYSTEDVPARLEGRRHR